NRPRPVVGTTGLTPSWWHWSFERYGAPQLNSRFEKAHGRRMLDQDWGTWVAVRAIVQSVLRVRSTEFEKVTAFMRGDRLRIDGFKGPALSFRPWNNQLRQPILIATHDAMIKTAPVDGFLHETETLDTLGDDRANSSCRF
ncbi:MAG: amino acid ABC transporter substrate-binding protein, partial [Proteobacteria bacterium]|nr:amino acid ABC transporter substrate-binding protein [Pseudomonadota bacterium]